MLELTVLGSLLRGISVLYWLLAIAALGVVLWKLKGPLRMVSALAVVAIFGWLPAKQTYEAHKRETYAREAWAYFKKLCDEKAGEKIYKTFTGVKSVLVVKPLPPAKDDDHFDQFWYGDPYSASATSARAKWAATALTLSSRRPSGVEPGLEFVEMKVEANDAGTRYQRITRPASNNEMAKVDFIEKPVSRFGIAWEDISTPNDRAYWVAGSRLQVIDLADNSVVAERIGYFIEAGFGSRAAGRRPWLTSRGPRTTCPPLLGGDYSDQWFITKALRQKEEK